MFPGVGKNVGRFNINNGLGKSSSKPDKKSGKPKGQTGGHQNGQADTEEHVQTDFTVIRVMSSQSMSTDSGPPTPPLAGTPSPTSASKSTPSAGTRTPSVTPRTPLTTPTASSGKLTLFPGMRLSYGIRQKKGYFFMAVPL